MKRLVVIITVIACIFSFNGFAIASQSIEIPELKLSIDIPDDYIAVTSETPTTGKTADILYGYGISIETLKNTMKSNNLYLEAINYNDATEITILSIDMENTPELKNANDIESIMENFSNDFLKDYFPKESNDNFLQNINIESESVNKEMINDVLYITYNTMGMQNGIQVYTKNYYTVTRNHGITIKLFSYNSAINEFQNKLIETLVNSITFSTPESTQQANESTLADAGYNAIIGGIVAAIVAGISSLAVWFSHNKKKKIKANNETSGTHIYSEEDGYNDRRVPDNILKNEDQIIEETDMESEKTMEGVQKNEIHENEQMLFCRECGNRLSVDSKYCYICGMKVTKFN